MSLAWHLHVGRIRTDEDSVFIHHNTGDFFAAEIDLVSKYPLDLGHMDLEDGVVVFLLSDKEDTLRVDEASADNTTFILRGPHISRWHFITQASRYTWYIAGYRRDEAVG